MITTEAVETDLRARIAAERERELHLPADGVYQRIAAGDILRATGKLLFHTPPTRFPAQLKSILDTIVELYPGADDVLRRHMLEFLVKLAVDLRSFLPNWHLASELSPGAIVEAADRVLKLLSQLEHWDGPARDGLLDALRQETRARLKAEGVSDAGELEELTRRLVGDSLSHYVIMIGEEINRSNLIEVARARFRGDTITQLGNDYAALLQYAVWLGASFVTTNPVLVKIAWDTNPDLWNRRVDELILTRYTPARLRELLAGPADELERAVAGLNSLVTMAVVEENCRLLRDIFLVTEGREGYVSLQVNPKNHRDAEVMIQEALELYAGLQERLGGVPNVVFKLPATAAGKVAAEALTSRGIGVNITVNFSVFQEVGFGEVLQRGHALVAYLALMNGRMATPVRDEMKEKGVPGGEEAARWAGVEVARKAFHRLYDPPSAGGLGIDVERVKLLIASLRIYEDWFPDISELWGCPVMTIFPNVRRAYDAHPRPFDGQAVLGETPADVLETLLRSEIFRQAWWMPGDAEEHRPARVLTLEPADAEALAQWPPMAQTLGQFIQLYDQMGEMVLGRMRRLAA